MKYKMYSELVNPPTSQISGFKGRYSFQFDNIWGLFKVIRQEVEKISLHELIESYKEYAELYAEDRKGTDLDNFNPKQFKIDCLTYEYQGLNEGLFAIYNIEKDPDEKEMTWLYLVLEVFDYGNFYHVDIKPFLDGPVGNEPVGDTCISTALEIFFYKNWLAKKVKKLTLKERGEYFKKHVFDNL